MAKYEWSMGLLLIVFSFSQHSYVRNPQTYAGFINKVQAYQNNVKLAMEKKGTDDIRSQWLAAKVDSSTFDVDYYLSLFDQCKPVKGYRFYLYQAYGQDGGSPVLFAKADTFNEQAYYERMVDRNTKIWDSLINSHKLKGLSEERLNMWNKRSEELKKEALTRKSIMGRYALDSLHRSFRYFVPKDSGIGYLQYLFLKVMGEQFALYWHANYGYKKIISDKGSVEYYLKYYHNNSDFRCDTAKLADLLKVDVSPRVTLNSTDCTITWYEIETHNGLYKRTYTVQRHSPYLIRQISSEKVVEMNANFFY